jgi:glycosyltransferase involved in cell wall biosynthesis
VAADFLRESGAGLCVPCGDAGRLAEAIARLLDDDALRARCGRAGRAYAEAHLNHARAVDAYESALEKAAGR